MKYLTKVVVAAIAAVAPIIVAVRGCPSNQVVDNTASSDVVIFSGRVINSATNEGLSGVELSIDARPVPRHDRTDGSGAFSVSVPRGDVSLDVQILFRKDGFASEIRKVPRGSDQFTNIAMRPAKAPGRSRGEPSAGPAPAPRSGGDSAAGGSSSGIPALPPPALVNEGPRTAGGTAVLVVDARGQTDMTATRELAAALGATDSLFTQQFIDKVFQEVHRGNVDALRSLHLERFSTIALGVVSTRATPKTVQGASFVEGQARMDIRVVRPSLNFDARLIAAQGIASGFDEERVTRASLDKAIAQSINQLKPLF